MCTLNMLIKLGQLGKKIIIILIIGAMLLVNTSFNNTSYAESPPNNVDIVIRVGEYDGKPGKRVYVENIKNIPTDIKLCKDEHGFYIQEYDINYKLANKIANKLADKGLNVNLQDTKSRSQDLNAAGRIAKEKNPEIYLSVHHNSFRSDSEGYFFMFNEEDKKSEDLANKLSDSIKDNTQNIPQMKNRTNLNNYIGELNQSPGDVNILGEFGFFSNRDIELPKIISDNHTDEISTNVANELYSFYKERFNDNKEITVNRNINKSEQKNVKKKVKPIPEHVRKLLYNRESDYK